jgi:hypothetical protein
MRDYFDWTTRAACKSMNPEDFARPKDSYEAREAKRVCQLKCPVKQDCLSHATIYNESGLWGGYAQTERAFIGDDIREDLMRIAILDGVFRAEYLRDVKGVRIYLELLRQIGPRTFPRKDTDLQGPMAA